MFDNISVNMRRLFDKLKLETPSSNKERSKVKKTLSSTVEVA